MEHDNSSTPQTPNNTPVASGIKIPKKILIIIGVACVAVLAAAVALVLVLNRPEKVEEKPSNPSPVAKTELDLETSADKLKKALDSGRINPDTYIQQLAYAGYEPGKLSPEYKSDSKLVTCEHVFDEAEQYVDKLSKPTLEYLWQVLMLDGVSFKQGATSRVGSTATLAANSSKADSLDKAVQSSGGKIVVWYTESGSSKSSRSDALATANGLEKTIASYEDIFGKSYQFKSRVLGSGSKQAAQKSILKEAGIDESKLASAMQVYMVEYGDDGLAAYTTAGGLLSEKLQELFGSANGDGAILYPYMRIKPSSFGNKQRLEELYNHELVHHFQYYVWCADADQVEYCDNKDKANMVTDGVAHYGSALASAQNAKSYLNEFAMSNLIFTDKLYSTIQEHGGYYLYTYLDSYSKYVAGANQIFTDSIYQPNSLKYIESKASSSQLKSAIENKAMRQVTQDYDNLNYKAYMSGQKAEPKIAAELGKTESFVDQKLEAISIRYYHIAGPTHYELDIEASSNISLVFAYKDGGSWRFKSIDSDASSFDTSQYSYTEAYVVVANRGLVDSATYTLKAAAKSSNEGKKDNSTDASNQHQHTGTAVQCPLGEFDPGAGSDYGSTADNLKSTITFFLKDGKVYLAHTEMVFSSDYMAKAIYTGMKSDPGDMKNLVRSGSAIIFDTTNNLPKDEATIKKGCPSAKQLTEQGIKDLVDKLK